MKNHFYFLIFTVTVLSSLARCHLQAQSYHIIGDQTWAWDVTNSGVVAAQITNGNYFVWTPSEGLVNIGGIADGGQVAISNDGNLIGGNAINPSTNLVEAALYNRTTQQWQTLGSLGSNSGSSASTHWGMNRTGTVSVGLGWVSAGSAHAVRFDNVSGTALSLGSSVSGRSSRANAVNADGSVIVGWQDAESGFRQGAIWEWDGTNYNQSLIVDPNGNPMLEAGEVTADGRFVIGGGNSSTRAWRFDTVTGDFEFFGQLGVHTFNPSYGATSISDDGRIVIGFERSFPPNPLTGTEPFIWIEGQGTFNLNNWVTNTLGIDLGGTRLTTVLGISGNGQYIVGINNQFQGFVINTIPEPGSLWLLMTGSPICLLRHRRRQSIV
jgi:hypothetical protein